MMLAGGGALGGVRLLGPKTVELIHADVLGDIPRGAGGPWPGDGFGLTVEVSRGPGPTGTNSSAGEFDWAGVGGTSFFVDPHEELTAVLMMQVIPGTPYWGRMLRQMTEQAVIEP
jgi:CubicO group peptidase (beta-lactamase class C family)